MMVRLITAVDILHAAVKKKFTSYIGANPSKCNASLIDKEAYFILQYKKNTQQFSCCIDLHCFLYDCYNVIVVYTYYSTHCQHNDLHASRQGLIHFCVCVSVIISRIEQRIPCPVGNELLRAITMIVITEQDKDSYYHLYSLHPHAFLLSYSWLFFCKRCIAQIIPG